MCLVRFKRHCFALGHESSFDLQIAEPDALFNVSDQTHSIAMAAVDTGDLSQLCRTVLEILTTIRISPSRRGSAMKVRQTRAEWPFPVRRLLRRAPRSLNHLIIFVRSFTFNVTVVVKKNLNLSTSPHQHASDGPAGNSSRRPVWRGRRLGDERIRSTY